MRRIVLLLAGLILCSVPSFGGECLTNEEQAFGLRVVFSELVSITAFGDMFTIVEPQEKAREFVFCGGVLDPWVGHWMNWEPAAALLVSHEWLKAPPEFLPTAEGVPGTDRFLVPAEDGWWTNVLLLSDGSGDESLLREFNPDAFNWTWERPGLPWVYQVAAAHSEYQELYIRSLEGSLDDYAGSMARDIQGDSIHRSSWGDAYVMDPHAPGWASTVFEWILEAIGCCGRVDGVSQDNIGVPPFIDGGGGFSAHEKKGFREWLKERHTTAELAEMGVGEIEDLDIAEYILENGFFDGNAAALEDRVFREFVLYQYHSNLEIWEGIRRRVRGAVEEKVVLHGNQYGVWKPSDSNPYSVLLSQFHQIIEIESGSYKGGMPPAVHHTLPYKIGLASGFMEKPVWIRGISYDWRSRETKVAPTFMKLTAAETYANGAVRTLILSQITPEGAVGLPGETTNSLLEYHRWVSDNRHLFLNRSSAARVALVYSVPTLLWRSFPTTGHWNYEQNASLSGMALALECTHVPYDVVIFGHPDLWSDEGLGARLENYDLVILPSADCLSDFQIRALEDYLENDGSILFTGDLGARDEGFATRSPSRIARLQASPSVRELAGSPGREFYEKRRARQPEADAVFARIVAGIDALPVYERQITTSAPETIAMNIYAHQTGGISIQLLNYGYDEDTDSLDSCGPFELQLRVPEGFSLGDSDVFLTEDRGHYEALDCSLSEGRLSISVPSVSCHAILGIADLDGLRMAIPGRETPVIIFDDSHRQGLALSDEDARAINPDHPEWVTLAGLAPYVTTSHDARRVSPGVLQGCDIYVIAAPGRSFSSTEVAALKEFVAGGGGLLLIGNAWAPQLSLVPLGIVLDQYPVGESQHLQDFASFDLDDVVEHSVTEHANTIRVNWSSTMTVGPEWQILAETSEESWQERTGDDQPSVSEARGPFPILAVREYGEGRIVAMSDDHSFWEQGDPFLVRAILDWLAGG